MLGRWHTNKLLSGEEVSPVEQQLYELTREKVSALSAEDATSPEDLAFLERDFQVDVAKLRVPLSFKQVIEQRLDEIDRCLEAKAPLAVIFLCGSTPRRTPRRGCPGEFRVVQPLHRGAKRTGRQGSSDVRVDARSAHHDIARSWRGR